MSEKLPYYMAYPMPFVFDDERMERRDYEYMTGMYPVAAKRAMPYVEEACDRMDYRLSMMYDEYPDRLQLRRMASSICKKMQEDGIVEDKEPVKGTQFGGEMWGRDQNRDRDRDRDRDRNRDRDRDQDRDRGRNRDRDAEQDRDRGRRNPFERNNLRDLVEVLLLQEVQRRRREHRREERRFYPVRHI